MYKLDSSKIKIYFNKMLDFSLEIWKGSGAREWWWLHHKRNILTTLNVKIQNC
jgi:hypothetical protein